jgi:hypothetical protein
MTVCVFAGNFPFWSLLGAILVLGSTQEKPAPRQVEITLAVSRSVYNVGEPVELHIEIRNNGRKGVFIGSEFIVPDNWMYGTHLELTNEQGEKSPPFGVGVVDAGGISDFHFASELADHWILLQPRSFYGRTLQVDANDFDFLAKPGRYSIRARYHSEGFQSKSPANRLPQKPEELKQVSYPSWTGEIESNSVWITILAPGKGRH